MGFSTAIVLDAYSHAPVHARAQAVFRHGEQLHLDVHAPGHVLTLDPVASFTARPSEALSLRVATLPREPHPPLAPDDAFFLPDASGVAYRLADKRPVRHGTEDGRVAVSVLRLADGRWALHRVHVHTDHPPHPLRAVVDDLLRQTHGVELPPWARFVRADAREVGPVISLRPNAGVAW